MINESMERLADKILAKQEWQSRNTPDHVQDGVARLAEAVEAALGDYHWTMVTESAWIPNEVHAESFDMFGIETKLEICGIKPDGREVHQLIEILQATINRLRQHLDTRRPLLDVVEAGQN